MSEPVVYKVERCGEVYECVEKSAYDSVCKERDEWKLTCEKIDLELSQSTNEKLDLIRRLAAERERADRLDADLKDALNVINDVTDSHRYRLAIEERDRAESLLRELIEIRQKIHKSDAEELDKVDSVACRARKLLEEK